MPYSDPCLSGSRLTLTPLSSPGVSPVLSILPSFRRPILGSILMAVEDPFHLRLFSCKGRTACRRSQASIPMNQSSFWIKHVCIWRHWNGHWYKHIITYILRWTSCVTWFGSCEKGIIFNKRPWWNGPDEWWTGIPHIVYRSLLSPLCTQRCFGVSGQDSSDMQIMHIMHIMATYSI